MPNSPTPSSERFRKLPSRYNAIVMPLVLSILMSCIVSGISTLSSMGLTVLFPGYWMDAWFVSWLVAFPSLLLVLPVVRRIVSALVQQPEALPRQ